MKKFSMAVGAAIALAGVTAPAQAQNLTWYGMNACWQGSTYSLDNGGYKSVSSNCGTDQDLVRNEWGQTGNTTNRSWVEFDRLNTPGGPDGSTSTISFSGLNDWTIFKLGHLTYRNGTVTPSGNTSGFSILNQSNFSISMFLGAGTTPTFNYFSKVNMQNNEDGGTDNVAFTGGAFQSFSSGGHDYEFRIAGFDNSSQNICEDRDIEDVDFLPQTLTASAGSSTDRAVCGKIYYRGRSVPNIQTVPEPSTYALMGAGLLGIFGFARRRRVNA